jgi:DNA modification methylase
MTTRILIGDCREVLKTLPDDSVHCCVTSPPALAERCITAGCPVEGTVLDPFGGSGTVGMAADRQHKHAILIDLDERNLPMATDRIKSDSPLFAEVSE